MTVGEYVSIFVSIVLGLAVADLAFSLHRLLVARDRVRWDWLSPTIALFTAMNIVAFWWAAYRWYNRAPNLTVIQFLPDFALFVLVFLAAAAALPDEVPAEGMSLKEFYFCRSRYFWAITLLQLGMVLIFVAPRYVAHADLRSIAANQIGNLPLWIGATVLMATKREWVHRVVVPLTVPYTIWSYISFELIR